MREKGRSFRKGNKKRKKERKERPTEKKIPKLTYQKTKLGTTDSCAQKTPNKKVGILETRKFNKLRNFQGV